MEKNNDDIKVSVLVITYNHEKFLRECLDSIVCQKTNFKFEVIIHDDKSTDKTVEIINEYKAKHPKLIVPIFEKENQYSLGKNITEECMLPFAKGKYIAVCEGDDRWCDENKLQKQYDFMETHSDYVACFHNTIYHDLSGEIADFKVNKIKKKTVVDKRIVFTSIVHTSSYFVKRKYFKSLEFGKGLTMGDYVLFTSLFTYGKMMIIPDVMSIYNIHNPYGVMMTKINTSKKQEIIEKQIKYLKQYNEYTNRKYNRQVERAWARMTVFGIYDTKLANTDTRKQFKKELIRTRKSDEYKILMRNSNLRQKLKIFVKYHLPKKLFIKYKG